MDTAALFRAQVHGAGILVIAVIGVVDTAFVYGVTVVESARGFEGEAVANHRLVEAVTDRMVARGGVACAFISAFLVVGACARFRITRTNFT